MCIIFLRKGAQAVYANNASKFLPSPVFFYELTCRQAGQEETWDNKRTFIYSLSTATGTLRGHLERYHEEEVITVCQRKGWPIQLPKYKAQHALTIKSRVPFSAEAVLDHLVKFISVNDQVRFCLAQQLIR